MFLLWCQAIFLGPRAAYGTSAGIILEHGIRTGTGARKSTVLFDQEFDGNSRQPQRHQADSQQYHFPFHATNLTTPPALWTQMFRNFQGMIARNPLICGITQRSLLLLVGGLLAGWSQVRAQGSGCGCPPVASREVIYVSDGGGVGTGNATWTCDKIWVLTEPVFVNPGHTLTIEPGTIIQGREGIVIDTLSFVLPNGNPSQRKDYVFSQLAGSLVVAMDAFIFAEGSPDCPIVFTYEGDPMDNSTGYDVQGRWGGLIVCGRGALNTYDGNDLAEGVTDPTGQNRALYGTGQDPTGSSGVLRYLSIRHASTSLGISQFGNGNETNALQLCGVGSGTTVEYIETIASGDDGIQIFGGLVDVRYIGTVFNKEDAIEFDQGWRGQAQFIFALTDELNGCGEHAGDYEGDDFEEFDVHPSFMPYTSPLIYNQTYIGRGGIPAIRLHNGGGVRMHNSIFAGFSLGIDFEDFDPCDAWELLLFGETTIRNNRFHDIGDSTGLAEMIRYDGVVFNGQLGVQNHFTQNFNGAGDPAFDYTFTVSDGFVTEGIDLRPGAGTMEVTPTFLPTDAWFTPAAYRGAFEPEGENWLSGWTYMEQLGLFGEPPVQEFIGGCTYVQACNYNPAAEVEDGTCEFVTCSGCTYSWAPNFNPAALWDDGSCLEPDTLANDCPTDIDGNGQVGTTDLLFFLSTFGDLCP